MSFVSVSFFIFVPVVYLIFCLTPDRWRWLVLLAASYGFYASLKAPYLLAALATVTCVSYICGRRLAAHPDGTARRCWFWTGNLACLAVLCLFKYLPFMQERQVKILGWDPAELPRIATVAGVSYFTFQALSYLADLYLELDEPETHPGRFALYLAFFPKLLMGPIERGADLLPQFKKDYRFDYDAVRSGMILFTWGLFQKVVVADRVALYADMVYDDVHAYTGLTLVIGTYAYAMQIYFGFAGYTDMARGIARIFGISLTENFRQPYLATSIAEFWRRWHISFSRWILDYIFKPLQLAWRDQGQAGTALALLTTFAVSGLWHGATSGFIAWGLLHGVYLAGSSYYRPFQKRLHKRLGLERTTFLRAWQVFVTFNLVSFAWIFFRAASLGDAWYVVTHLCEVSGDQVLENFLGHNEGNLMVTVTCLSLLFLAAVRPGLAAWLTSLFEGKKRWFFYYAFVMLILICGSFGKNEFVYVRF